MSKTKGKKDGNPPKVNFLTFYYSQLNFQNMKENSTAQKIEQGTTPKNVMQIVKSESTPTEKIAEKPANQETTKNDVIQEAPKLQTIEEIKRKNEVLRRLTERYDRLNENRKRVENFKLSHDTNTASVEVSDALGEVFESNSPKTIKKLIEFWLDEFNTALKEVEEEIRLNA